MDDFPDRLREARSKAGLTQQELAAVIDVSKPTMSLYESGKMMPRDTKLHALADALGVSFLWLKNGSDGSELISGELKEKLIEAARITGRSLNDEIKYRLAQTLDLDEQLSDRGSLPVSAHRKPNVIQQLKQQLAELSRTVNGLESVTDDVRHVVSRVSNSRKVPDMQLMDVTLNVSFSVVDESGQTRAVSDVINTTVDLNRWLSESNQAVRDYCATREDHGWLKGKTLLSSTLTHVEAQSPDGTFVALMKDGYPDWAAAQGLSNEPALSQQDLDLLSFTHDDFAIHNPFVTECGRFACTPDVYGFTKRGDGAWFKVDAETETELVYSSAIDGQAVTGENAWVTAYRDGAIMAQASLERVRGAFDMVAQGIDPLAPGASTSLELGS